MKSQVLRPLAEAPATVPRRGAFEGGQTSGLKAVKTQPLKADGPSVWPVMFSGRVALDGLAGGEVGFGKACGSMVFGRWCLAEELPWMGLRGACLLEQAWTW